MARATAEHMSNIVRPHLILSVLQHLIICLFVFFDSLLELDAVDLDAEQLVRESAVVVENITVINFPSLYTCPKSIHKRYYSQL